MGLLRTDVSRVEIERVLLSEESVGLAPLTIIANEYPVEAIPAAHCSRRNLVSTSPWLVLVAFSARKCSNVSVYSS